MAKIERVMALPDPEDIVGASPFLAQGKNGAGQEVIYYKTPDGRRIEVAEVVKPAEGLKDKLGTYRQMLTDAQLNGAGIMEPFIAKPKNAEEAKKNMRVEFRIIKVPAEALKPADFDY